VAKVKPTHHSELEKAGFRLHEERTFPGGDRTGDVTRRHYVSTRNSVGDGKIVRPIDHHVIVDEYSRNPGKFDAFYHVTQDQQPYADGEYDGIFKNSDNHHGVGTPDPIKMVMFHHSGISSVHDKNNEAEPLHEITPLNVHRLAPVDYHTTGGGTNDPDMKNMRYIKPGYDDSMHYLNSFLKTADEFDDIIQGNSYSGNCSNCGKAVRHLPESGFRDDKLYHLTPEDDNSDTHGAPVPLCGECYVDPDMHEKAHRMPKMLGWHNKGSQVGKCPECDSEAMDEADEDLR